MGVDSGLPDFRGKEGFWMAYPVFQKLGYSFEEMANPEWFNRDPHQAWGFYGHRLNAYRDVIPHHGYEILLKWMNSKPQPGFVFTSNVDGHFQKAGFPEAQIYECHGSIHWLQSCLDSSGTIWSGDDVEIKVDDDTCRAKDPLPCGSTGDVARPNILMFGDWMWNGRRSDEQHERLSHWIEGVRGTKAVIVELGAGKAVPTVRMNCERLSQLLLCPVIRINPRDAEGPRGTLCIHQSALLGLQEIDTVISLG